MKRWMSYLGPLLAAVFVCAPAYRGEFIWDDRGLYILDNELMRRADGLWRFWFTTDCVDYYPLTYTAFWLTWQLAGADPRLYHVINFGLHGVATVLLIAILRRLAVPLPWLVGLVFAVHPLQVETVAWISQQKTLLATALGFAAVLEFLSWEQHADRRSGGRCLGLFALSLAAKPVFITLPVGATVWLAWRRSVGSRRAVALLVGLFGIAAVFGVIGIPFQLKGFKPDVRGHDFVTRVTSLGWTAWFYVGKTVWFLDPCFIYPRWRINGLTPLHWLPNIGILITTAVLAQWRAVIGVRPLAAWLAYLITMLPALGVVDVGFWQFSYVADHYVYQSLPALLVLLIDATLLIALRVPAVAESEPHRRATAGLAVAGCIVAAGMACVSWTRSCDYRTEFALWQHTVTVNPAAEIAWYGLARDAARRQDFERAEEFHRKALELAPDIDRSWKAYGDVLRERRKWPEAHAAYAHCLEMAKRPSRVRVFAALGMAAADIRLGRPQAGLDLLEAIVATEIEGVRLQPSDQAEVVARAAVYRHTALEATGDGVAARACASALQRLLEQVPDARAPAGRALDEMAFPKAAVPSAEPPAVR
jgi:hypothetical protein